jgi:hypothetical protein
MENLHTVVQVFKLILLEKETGKKCAGFPSADIPSTTTGLRQYE